ncbi:MAG TPA: VOC family protein [Pelolinea sp.]|nr:VOC family protein [Pelolinea sp.]
MSRVIHFEITAKDPEMSVVFYKKVFGWKFEKWDGPMEYWLISTGDNSEEGINGGLGRRGDEPPGTVNTIDVPDAKEYLKAIEKNGGKVISPVHAIPGVGWAAYFEDPDGNQWGIMQDDPGAK